MPPPAAPKIYHIVHVDRLPSIIRTGGLICDAAVRQAQASGHSTGTMIGMAKIKERRLTQRMLSSHRGLYVGQCVPFYFCPRSIMLYQIHRANHPELTYKGGQDPIPHLEADLHNAVNWADRSGRRWAFTLSNAGADYAEDRADLSQLGEIAWDAVQARNWQDKKEGKQAEFLMEGHFPWHLIDRVGVRTADTLRQVKAALQHASHQPPTGIEPNWYYD